MNQKTALSYPEVERLAEAISYTREHALDTVTFQFDDLLVVELELDFAVRLYTLVAHEITLHEMTDDELQTQLDEDDA